MILPYGFRRLRLAECSVKPASSNTKQRRLLSGHLFKSPGARSERVTFTCSDRAVLQRKLEQLAEGGHGGAGTHRGSLLERQRPRGDLVWSCR